MNAIVFIYKEKQYRFPVGINEHGALIDVDEFIKIESQLDKALDAIKEAKQSHCGAGASVARQTTCADMRKIASEAIDQIKKGEPK